MSRSLPCVVVESVSRDGLRGSHQRLEVADAATVSVLRRLRFESGAPLPDEEAEVDTLATPAAVDAVLRQVPLRPAFAAGAGEEVRIPWEVAAAIAQDPVGAMARYASSALGWAEVPDVLASLLDGISSEATIAVFGRSGPSVHRWISGDRGWVSLALAHGDVVLTACTRDDIAHSLTRELALAVAHG